MEFRQFLVLSTIVRIPEKVFADIFSGVLTDVEK